MPADRSGDTTLPQQRAELERQRVIVAGRLAEIDELLAENASAQQYPPVDSRSHTGTRGGQA